jgi:hypothetical protein
MKQVTSVPATLSMPSTLLSIFMGWTVRSKSPRAPYLEKAMSKQETIEDARLRDAASMMLEALLACDEAMAYMSEYDIPITLPGQVKAAIKKATGE